MANFFVFTPTYAQVEEEANLRLVFDKAYLPESSNFTIAIEGSADSGNVNIFSIHLSYDPAILLLEKVEYTKGICEYIILENLNKAPGKIDFACGTNKATAAFAIAELIFKKINSGWSEINLDDSRFYLANGRGDTVFPATGTHRLFVSE